MKFVFPNLNDKQLEELAKVFLDIGKAVFLGSIGAYFLPTLGDRAVPSAIPIIGSLAALIFILIGLILLREKQK